jgi:hypothetical protein
VIKQESEQYLSDMNSNSRAGSKQGSTKSQKLDRGDIVNLKKNASYFTSQVADFSQAGPSV